MCPNSAMFKIELNLDRDLEISGGDRRINYNIINLNCYCEFKNSQIGLGLMSKCIIYSGIQHTKIHFFWYSPEGAMTLPYPTYGHQCSKPLSKRGIDKSARL
jgi:hypothetical protein